MRIFLSLALWLVALASTATAHEVRPGYLELREKDADTYDIVWKVPADGEDLRFGFHVRFPTSAGNDREPVRRYVGNAFISRWTVRVAGGLTGETIHVDGMRTTMTDVIVRIERLDGDINAVVVRDFERAREAAKRADAALAAGNLLGRLHGVPMTIKESYDIEGLRTTWGHPLFRENVASSDSQAVESFKGAGALFTFAVKGGYDACVKLIDSVELFSHVANLGDARSLIIHSASTTHRQLSEVQQVAAGASPNVVRVSIGIENAADIIADLDQALTKATS